jgi:dihydroorotate dehydrogenase (NAD+) catalytic subunit
MAAYTSLNVTGLLSDLAQVVSPDALTQVIGTRGARSSRVVGNEGSINPGAQLRLALFCMKNNLVEVYRAHGGLLPSFNIYQPFSFENSPFGAQDRSSDDVFLKRRPTLIGGFRVGYPFGVPASALTGTSQWVNFYAKRGFDILTYKTVRTREWQVHQYPNWVFIPNPPVFTHSDVEKECHLFWDPDYFPEDPTQVTMANSFGIPSQIPEVWQEEVENSKTALSSDQVLVVSVTGTSSPGDSFEDLTQDFVRAALMAKEAGADIIELNFSCPNVPGHQEGSLYTSPSDAASIARAVHQATKDRPFVKTGYLPYHQLTELVHACQANVKGYTAINTVSAHISDRQRHDIFPPSPVVRSSAGISGTAIKQLALEVVEGLATLRDKEHLEYDILAVGGVTSKQDVDRYLIAGADGVQSCTGAFINPELALDVRHYDGQLSRDIVFSVNESEERGGNMTEKERPTKDADRQVPSDRNAEQPKPDERVRVSYDTELVERLTDVDGIKELLLAIIQKPARHK